MAILGSMASKVIRTTYALDEETVGLLSDLAARQGTSKSEALRRAIRLASRQDTDPAIADRLAALHELQTELALTEEEASRWIAEVRAERDAWEPPER